MKYKIMNRWMAEEYDTKKNAICISIFGQGSQPIDNKAFHTIYPMNIDDIDLKTETLAKELENLEIRAMRDTDVYFIEKIFISSYIANEEVEEIIVHCDAGIARSSAIMILIHKLWNLDYEWIYRARRYMPNKYMLKMICDIHGWQPHDIEYLKEIERKSKIIHKSVNLESLINDLTL